MRILKSTNLMIAGMVTLFAVGVLVSSSSYADLNKGLVAAWTFDDGTAEDNRCYLLAIDLGTMSCKVAIFSDAGELIGQARADLMIYYPQPTWVEAAPDDWWAIVVKLRRSKISVK